MLSIQNDMVAIYSEINLEKLKYPFHQEMCTNVENTGCM